MPTVSTSRTLQDDESGDAIAQAIEDDGHAVVERELVGDDRETARAAVLALAESAEAVVVTGETGLAPDDMTVDAVVPLCDRETPGFGDLGPSPTTTLGRTRCSRGPALVSSTLSRCSVCRGAHRVRRSASRSLLSRPSHTHSHTHNRSNDRRR